MPSGNTSGRNPLETRVGGILSRNVFIFIIIAIYLYFYLTEVCITKAAEKTTDLRWNCVEQKTFGKGAEDTNAVSSILFLAITLMHTGLC